MRTMSVPGAMEREMRSSRWWAIGVALMAVTAIAGCGSGTTGAGGANTGGTTPAASGSTTTPAGAGSSGTSTSGGARTTIRVASNSNAGVLPVWVAIEEGIFAKHGLDVQFTKVDNVGTLPPALNKTFDIALVTPAAAIVATSKGIPVTEVAGAYTDTADHPGSWLMVKKGSDIKTLADLKGKTIGTLTIAGTLNYATLNMLKQAGVAPDSVKVIAVNGPEQLAQLNAGRIDAVQTVQPFELQIAAAGGVSLGHPYQSMAQPLSAIWWGANPVWASAHAGVVQQFRESLTDAIAYIKANDTQARSVLEKYTNYPTALIKKYPFPQYDAAVSAPDISKWIDVLKEFAGFKGNVDPGKLVFNP